MITLESIKAFGPAGGKTEVIKKRLHTPGFKGPGVV